MIYNKLVRDHIPHLIRENGADAVFRTLSDDEYAFYLEKKLDEEVGEYHREQNAEELADILEVIYALAKLRGVSKEELERIYACKHEARGGFDQKILLLETK